MTAFGKRLRIAVGIATSGRAEILGNVVSTITEQTRQPDSILICPAKAEDAGEVLNSHPAIKIVLGRPGLPHQRNTILSHCDADLLLFLDDDFLMQSEYIEELEKLFLSSPEVVVATGLVTADGIRGPGFSFEEGRRLLVDLHVDQEPMIRETYGGYGCNMALRLETVRQHGLEFDENLPLYAWLEDIDFSRQLAKYGRVVKSTMLRGVHLGTKGSGRSSGMRLGYSQIANPVYLARKGTLSWAFSMKYMRRQFIANCVRSVKPEPWVDRRGRLKGNILAIYEVFRGRSSPSRILAFK